jgi:hypothetical protein
MRKGRECQYSSTDCIASPAAFEIGRLSVNMALFASALLGVAVAASAAIGWQALATALIGLTTTLALLAFLHLRRHLSVQIKNLARRFDVAQDGILALVEKERLTAAERQSALEAAQRRLGRDMSKIQREQTAETEALLQLFREFEPRAPMPSSGRWAMDPTRLLEVLFLIGRKLPKVVLELGSGTSSIWIACALEKGWWAPPLGRPQDGVCGSHQVTPSAPRCQSPC